MAGRQLELAEADALLRDRTVGPLEGFRSKLGRPFAAALKLTDANEVTFDFGDGATTRTRRRRISPARTPLGPCPKCGANVFETPQAYVCEKAVGPDKTLRLSLGTRDPAAPDRAGADGEAARDRQDRSAAIRLGAHAASFLGVSRAASRTARSASNSRRVTRRRRVGGAARAARRRRCACWASIRSDGKPVELFAGRYGPYVKHGGVNATVRDRERVDALTLDEALALLAEKSGKEAPARASARKGAAPKAADACARCRPRVEKAARSLRRRNRRPHPKTAPKAKSKSSCAPRPRRSSRRKPRRKRGIAARAASRGPGRRQGAASNRESTHEADPRGRRNRDSAEAGASGAGGAAAVSRRARARRGAASEARTARRTSRSKGSEQTRAT